MRLVSLETSGVRALADAAWQLGEELGEPPPMTVVTGAASAGLTTWLEAVAVTAARLSTAGPVPEPDRMISSRGDAATIRSTWLLDEEERRYGGLAEERTTAQLVFRRGSLPRADADPALLGLMSRYDHRPTTSKVVFVPALRAAEATLSPMGDFEAEQRRVRVSTDPGKYGGLARAVCRAFREDTPQFQRVADLFSRLCSTARLVGVAGNGQPDFAVDGGGRLPLSRLGFTERNAFSLAALPIVCGLERSLILLDTPEIGLPPGVAVGWVGALRETAPDAQWIVASRDPELVGSALPSARIVLARRR